MKRYLVACVVAGVLFVGGRLASAHHSFAATYLENQLVTIEGELAQLTLRNPHSFVYVDVTQPDGVVVRYLVEWASPAQLQGKVTRDTLRKGDHVVITGNPGRNQEDNRVRLLSFKRPKDGWTWGLLPDEQFK